MKSTFTFNFNEYTLRIAVYKNNIARVTYARKINQDDKSMIVVTPMPELLDIPIAYDETEREYRVSTDFLRICVDKATAAVRFERSEGGVLSYEFGPSLEKYEIYHTVGGELETKQTVDGVRASLEKAEREFLRISNHGRLTLKFSEDEALFGLGSHEEGYGSLKGQFVPLYQENMRIALPYLVSSKGYSYLFDCTSFMTFDGTDERYGRFTFDSVDMLDYYFICGADFDEVCRGYRFLTGETPMLPKWSIGYLQSKERYVSQENLLETAREYRRRQIPIDGIIQDWMYWPDNLWGYKAFDPSRYPAPSDMTAELHRMNLHVMISVWPNMSGDSSDRLEFEKAGKLLTDRSVYNAFDEEAREIYWRQAYEQLFRYGLDGWWCDSSEPYDAVWSGQNRPPLPERMKKSTDEFKKYIDDSLINAYSLAHSKGIYEGQRRVSDKRVINLTRSGYCGQHRYGTVVWSGDVSATWEMLGKQIHIVQNYIACGEAYWNSDIGGFFVRNGHEWFRDGDYDCGVKDSGFRELYTRWMQFACFTPLMRSHGTDTPREVWNFGERGCLFRDAIEKTIRLRYILSPYFYSVNASVTFDGRMPITPLALAFPGDRTARGVSNEYMYGHEFLVCPITHPMYYGAGSEEIKNPDRYADIYLPAGGWYDYYTERYYEGERFIRLPCTIDRIPLFVRAGSIVPTAPVMQYVDEIPDAVYEIRVYTGGDGEFTLYNDAGDGYGYENGEYTMVKLTYCDETGQLTETVSGTETFRHPAVVRYIGKQRNDE